MTVDPFPTTIRVMLLALVILYVVLAAGLVSLF
jgi:hypothetical protein